MTPLSRSNSLLESAYQFETSALNRADGAVEQHDVLWFWHGACSRSGGPRPAPFFGLALLRCCEVLRGEGSVMGQVSTLALAVLVVAAGVGLSEAEQDPTGAATGQASLSEFPSQMALYESSFLGSRSGELDGAPAGPAEVLRAFSHLGNAVTGQGGFWRRTVGVDWLRCQDHPVSAACERFERALGELQDWDEYLAKIAAVPEQDAGRFLARNLHRMSAYLTRYVPVEASPEGIQQTGFYRARLADVMPANL